MKRFLVSAAVGASFLLASCSSSNDVSSLKLRDMTKAEAMADFEEILSKVNTDYGPLKFKERRFGYSVDELAATGKAEILNATTDAEFFGTYQKFLSSFEDGHVGIRFTDNTQPIRRYRIPIFTTPVEGKAIVVYVADELTELGPAVGDEIVSVDGMTPTQYLDIYKKYYGDGNDITDEHNVFRMLYRDFFVTELWPTADTAAITYRRAADDSTHTVNATWREQLRHDTKFNFVTDGADAVALAGMAESYNDAAQGSWMEFAAVTPFFINDATKATYGIERVQASPDKLTAYGVDLDNVPEIYSALYTYEGKTILLIRQAGYGPSQEGTTVADYIATYRAILDTYDGFADALVIDQTHNPGGYVSYVTDLFRLFITPEMATGPNFVQANRANRSWIRDFADWAREVDPTLQSEASLKILAHSKTIEKAYDRGDFLSAPVPFDVDATLQPDDQYTWKKPILVLTNELAGSGGDAFPMVMQRSGRALTFGQRTMGLGGSVQEVATLSNSGASVRLTMGLFTAYREDGVYSEDQWIENNGVVPNIEHNLTVADFRAGYTGYVDAFSSALVPQLAQ